MMHSTMKQIATQNNHARPIFFSVPRNFEIFHDRLGQKDEIKEVTLRPEIWWHDAVYHEADHCMK